MSNTVDTAFIEKYDSEVKAAYQRMGPLLRPTVRMRTEVGAKRIYFPLLGKGEATEKARHADVVPMNLEHTRAYADMKDKYAPEYIDELDQVKINWSLRQDYSRASAAALGRATDAEIIRALNQSTNTVSAGTVNGGSSDLTLAVVLKLSENFNDLDVPADMERFGVITPTVLTELLQITGATSSDFTSQQLLTTGKAPANWMGFNWIVHSGLPTGVKGFFFHRSAVGLGFAQDVRSSVDWVPTKKSWLVDSYMSLGSTIVDGDGVQILEA